MASKVDVAINKAVQGTVVSVVICHECHSVSKYKIVTLHYCILQIVENLEPFFDLSLPIVTNASIEKVINNALMKLAIYLHNWFVLLQMSASANEKGT